MALRVCLECSTAYAVGPQVCPQCGASTRNAIYNWESDVAKANEHGSTYYLPEGAEVPPEIPPEVRLVGPGAPRDKLPKRQPRAAQDEQGEPGPAPEAQGKGDVPKAARGRTEVRK